MNKYIEISPEVQNALDNNLPIVALESTIISHGMPYPKNVETALNCQNIIRENGAVPATIAIINGKLKVGLTDEEIDKMMKEAEANKEADEKRREEVELKNKAEQYISEIDNAMATNGDKMDQNQKDQTQKLRDELQNALATNDIETLRKRIGELEQAAQQMYQYQQQQNANNGSVNPDDPIDADYSEKN